MKISRSFFVASFLMVVISFAAVASPEMDELLRHKIYGDVSVMSFTKEKMSELHQLWPEEEQARLKGLIEVDPYQTALDYYGFKPTPYDNASFPVGMTAVNSHQAYVNCLMCHSGNINGTDIPGLGNTQGNFALFAKDYIRLASHLPEAIIHRTILDYLYVDEPTDGASYAAGFAAYGLSIRDLELNLNMLELFTAPFADFQHLTSDPPAWWNVKYKKVLTVTGVSNASGKGMMEFMMGTTLSADQLKAQVPNFDALFEEIKKLEVPKFPLVINVVASARGKVIYEANCASCHGRLNDDGTFEYTQKHVPLWLVQTDKARSDIDTRSKALQDKWDLSWMSNYGAIATVKHPGTYIAPVLRGIWATAPYLHNGSVPTLRAILFHEERPNLWRRTSEYNVESPGLKYETVTEEEYSKLSWREKLKVYNTALYSQGNEGHPFGAKLSSGDKEDLLEYLKTL